MAAPLGESAPIPVGPGRPRQARLAALLYAPEQVRELLANRTVLLAGISHDLRTPLTRLRLGLEMLPSRTDRALVERMERDIDDLNGLITQTSARLVKDRKHVFTFKV